MGDSKLAKPSHAPATSEAKRQRRKSAPKETTKQETPSSSESNGAQWLPKGKNWDKDVKEVDTIVREGDAGLMAWLEFNNGHKAKLSVQACYEKCPLKVGPRPSQKATRILIAKLDAQVLRITPVSQALLLKARKRS
jgi:chromobox protein 1